MLVFDIPIVSYMPLASSPSHSSSRLLEIPVTFLVPFLVLLLPPSSLSLAPLPSHPLSLSLLIFLPLFFDPARIFKSKNGPVTKFRRPSVQPLLLSPSSPGEPKTFTNRGARVWCPLFFGGGAQAGPAGRCPLLFSPWPGRGAQGVFPSLFCFFLAREGPAGRLPLSFFFLGPAAAFRSFSPLCSFPWPGCGVSVVLPFFFFLVLQGRLRVPRRALIA